MSNKEDNYSPIRASFWFTVCNFFQKGMQFLTVPFFTRLLSTEEYGLFNVYQSWLGILTVFCTLTLYGGVFNNGMIQFEKQRDRYASSLQGLATTITFFVLLLFLVFNKIIISFLGLSFLLVLFMFVEILTTPSLQFWFARQRFDYKYLGYTIVSLSLSFITPVISIFTIWIVKENLGETRIISNGLVKAIVCLFIYIFLLKKGKIFFDKKFWKYAFFFNLPLLPHYLSQVLLMQVDRIMISKYVGIEKTGIYSVAYSAAMTIMMLSSALDSTLTPWIYKRIRGNETHKIPRVVSLVSAVIACVIICLVLIAPEVITILAPSAYREAIYVIPPVAASAFFITLYSFFGAIEFYYGENKFVLLASSIAAVLKIILNIILIPKIGYLAAGYTTLICYIFYAFLHWFFMKKTLIKHAEVCSVFNDKLLLIISLCTCILSVVLTLLYKFPIIRYGIILFLFIFLIYKRKEVYMIIKSVLPPQKEVLQ